MSAAKKGFSCLEFKRQVGLSRYETDLKLMHKVRAMMGKRDSLYVLKDMIEFADLFCGSDYKKTGERNSQKEKSKPEKTWI